MLLTFILIGGAAAAGVFGVKKGFDAKSNFAAAESLNRQAQEMYDLANNNLLEAQSAAQTALESLGEKKIAVYRFSLIPFVDCFSRIKNIDFQDGKVLADTPFIVTRSDMLAVKDVSLKMQDMLATGAGSLGAGGLVGLAVHGGMGLLGAGTAGAAIGGGGLAAGMGGGAMAAGGCGAAAGIGMGGGAAAGVTGCMAGGAAGGMAAGMGMGAGMAGGFGAGAVATPAVAAAIGTAGSAVVFGGVVAGPALAMGGFMMASKGENAMGDAQENLNRANAAAEQLRNGQTATEAVQLQAELTGSVLARLDERFQDFLAGLRHLVEKSTDYGSYVENDKKGVMIAALLAKTLKNVMETPVMDENGSITSASRLVLDESDQLMAALQVHYETR